MQGAKQSISKKQRENGGKMWPPGLMTWPAGQALWLPGLCQIFSEPLLLYKVRGDDESR
jgi:hypothetical protein